MHWRILDDDEVQQNFVLINCISVPSFSFLARTIRWQKIDNSLKYNDIVNRNSFLIDICPLLGAIFFLCVNIDTGGRNVRILSNKKEKFEEIGCSLSSMNAFLFINVTSLPAVQVLHYETAIEWAEVSTLNTQFQNKSKFLLKKKIIYQNWLIYTTRKKKIIRKPKNGS